MRDADRKPLATGRHDRVGVRFDEADRRPDRLQGVAVEPREGLVDHTENRGHDGQREQHARNPNADEAPRDAARDTDQMARDPLAERGFGASPEAAALYERGRPGYAPELAPFVVEALALDHTSRVLDLAAGTGQLSRVFAPLVGSVVAVEPSAAMRALIDVEALDGAAEAIPLADASVDAVVVGNAFHWFDGPAAVAEVRRVLRPGGGLAVIWNVGVSGEPEAPALAALTDARNVAVLPPHRRASRGSWKQALPPLAYEEFGHTVTLSRDAFVDYLASMAFVATAPDREQLLADMRALAPPSCVLTMRTECFYTRP
jgi:SAM-dependent methyltransferase